MDGDIRRNWWIFALRGLAAIAFGVLAFFMPAVTLAALVLLYGAYALADGILAIAAAIRRQGPNPWWALVLRGIVGIAAAAMSVFWPGITAFALLIVVAAWAIVTGVLEISAAIRLRKLIKGEWLMALGGVVSVLFGAALLLAPGPGILAVIWIIGSFAVAYGLLLMALGLRLRTRGASGILQEGPAF